MSQKKGKENIDLFESWIASTSNQDFKNMAYRGGLNKRVMEKTLPFSRSVLTQNTPVRKRYEQLLEELREKGVLAKKTEQHKAEENQPKMYDAEKNARAWDKNRLQKLEQEVIELKAKLKRYEEIADVITEMGIKF